MPEILPEHVPNPRTFLVWDGTRYRGVRGHTDGTVQVRGEDQLFSFGGVLILPRTTIISGVNGYVDSLACPANEIWIVTNVTATDVTSPITRMEFHAVIGATDVCFHEGRRAFVAAERDRWTGQVYLDNTGVIRAIFVGGLAGDNCQIHVIGYRMTLET